MRVLFILLLALTACSKSNDKCYECEVQRMDGSRYKEDVCTDDINSVSFTDQNNNALQSWCVEK